MADVSAAPMTLIRYGRSYQLLIETADDLPHLLHLDESHWMATSAPVSAFACDKVFLANLDSDHNGRIRTREVRDAVEWLLHALSGRDAITAGCDILQLDDINTLHDEGVGLRSAAERILRNIGRAGEETLSLAEIRDTKRILGAADANGDGIIPPNAAKDTEVSELLRDVIATVGGEADASGKTGVTETGLNQFLNEAAAYLAWHERGEEQAETQSALLPLDADTATAYAAFAAIRAKVDEYFRLSATLAYDPTIAARFRLHPESKDSDADTLDLQLLDAPIAPLDASCILNMQGPINPAYAAALDDFSQKVLAPILEPNLDILSAEQWRMVCATLASYDKWQKNKPATKTPSLGRDKLRTYLQPRFREAAKALIESDKAVAREISAIDQIEKLILYQRWILEFANNLVSFPKLYDPTVRALFETGTLVMDGRQFTLCVDVAARAEHVKLARNSKLCVIYLEITQSATAEKREVAAAVTSGGKGNLYVGKHGIFADRKGRLWDAQVTEIIENPISLSEAIVHPFRRLGALMQSQIERFAGSGEQLLEKKASAQVSALASGVQTAAQQPVATAQPPAAPRIGGMALLMGGGVALAAVGSAFAFICSKLDGVRITTIAYVIAAIVLAVLVPTTLNVWVKLRKRDLGTLLEACGWAINGRMRLTRVMQGVFTRRPRLPSNASKQRLDGIRKYAKYARRPFVHIAEKGRDAWDAL